MQGCVTIVKAPTEPLPTLTIERINTSLPMPTYAHEADSGFDLYAAEDVNLFVGETVLVPTGIRMSIPDGYEVQVRSRSSMASSSVIIPNSPGTVDSGYTGEIKVLMRYLGEDYDDPEDGQRTHRRYLKGDKICQAVLAPVTRAHIVEGVVACDTERGEGGFGSTGK